MSTWARLYDIPRLLFFLPELQREWTLLRRGGFAAWVLMSMLWMSALLPLWYGQEGPKTAVIPVAATLLAVIGWIFLLLPFRRSRPVWDLLVWENKIQARWVAPDQQANLALVQRAGELLIREPGQAAAALAGLVSPEPWLGFWAEFLQSQSQILDGKVPDTTAMERRLAALDADMRPRGETMLAVVKSGAERIAGKEWRLPLILCRNELGFHSTWRGLWPVRNYLIVLAAAPAVPWAWWLWAA